MKNIGIISRTQIINNKEFIGCYSNYIKKLKDKVNVFIIPYGSINEIKKKVEGCSYLILKQIWPS